MTRPVVLVDGVAIPLDAPAIAASDMGFLHGDTLFTTMAVHGGRPVLWEEHADRIERSAREFGYPALPGRDILYRECVEAVRLQPSPPTGLRLTLSRGRAELPGIDGVSKATIRVILPLFRPALSLEAITSGARAETFVLPWNPAADPRFAHKTGNLLWVKGIRKIKVHPDAVEQLLLSPKGDILEGTVSSVFAVNREGTLLTAPLSRGILPGIMRKKVLDWAHDTGRVVREEPPGILEADSYRELFLTSSTLPILPLRTITLSSGMLTLPQDFPVAMAFLTHYRRHIL